MLFWDAECVAAAPYEIKMGVTDYIFDITHYSNMRDVRGTSTWTGFSFRKSYF